MSELEELRNKISDYEKRMGIGENDPAKEGYLVLVQQLSQRNDYLKNFKLSEKIGNAAKDDPVYARAMDLIDSLPKMISAVNALKFELKMEGEKKQEFGNKPISPQTVALNGRV
jgi:hypothetical protein